MSTERPSEPTEHRAPYARGDYRYHRALVRRGVAEVLREDDAVGTLANMIRLLAPEWGGADRLPDQVIFDEWNRLRLWMLVDERGLHQQVQKARWCVRTEQRVQMPIGRFHEHLLRLVPHERLEAAPVSVTHRDLDVALCCFTVNVLFADGQCNEKAVIAFFRSNREALGRSCNSERYYQIRRILEEYGLIELAEPRKDGTVRRRAAYRPGSRSMRWRLGHAHPDAARQPPKSGTIPWMNVER